MKNKTHLIIIAVAIVASIAVLRYFTNSNKADSRLIRNAYETFLNQEFATMPDQIPDSIAKIPKADRPDLAAFHDYIATVDPKTKTVPKHRLIKAIEQMEALRQRGNGLEWQEMSSNIGGRTRMLMWDPNDSEHKKLWAGAVTGGLWCNEDIFDIRSKWQPINDFWNSLSISCMTYDPQNTETFYLGTGEAETAFITYRQSTGVGIGIWKSEDGGTTWNLLPSTSEFAYITDLKIRIENGVSTIYAAVVSGIYEGKDHKSAPSDGLYRSVDGGASWTQVLPQITGSQNIHAPSDIEFNADSSRIFVGTMPNINNEGGAMILQSDNGTNWTVYDNVFNQIKNELQYKLPGRVKLAAAPSNPNVLYAIIGAGYRETFLYSHGNYFIVTQNNGDSWTQRNVPQPEEGYQWASLAWHAFTIVVNPTNENHVNIGGLDMFRTLNGGQTWSQSTSWWNYGYWYNPQNPPFAHADMHAIIYRPENSQEAVIGTDGGVFYSGNMTATTAAFKEINIGYNTIQFYTCAIHPQAGLDYFLAGTQDNGTFRVENSPIDQNSGVSGGDGAYCFIDSESPDFQITSVYYNRYYTYSMSQNELLAQISDYYSGIFINPADYHSERNTLYANAQMLDGTYRDQILRISYMNSSPTGTFLPMNTGSSVPFSHVTVSPYSSANSSTLFIGTQAGRLFKVTNAQSSNYVVREIGDTEFPTANISCVAVGASEEVLLVTFSNYGVQSVWLTTDGGDTWTDKEANLPDMPIRWALIHPEDQNVVLLATETGIWGTNNLMDENTAYLPEDAGMPHVRVDMLRLRASDNTVIIATHGRGLFQTYFGKNLVSVNEPKESEFEVFPNPTTGQFTITGQFDSSVPIQIEIIDAKGKIITSESVQTTNGSIVKDVDLSEYASGLYLIRIKSKTLLRTQKLIKK